MVRGLADLIFKEDVVEAEYMTTVFVVVQKSSTKDFEESYERMAKYVVPKSGKLISEDSEYALYTCTLFKKCLEEFKLHAREKRYTLRDFTYDPNAVEADKAKKASDERELDRLRS